MRYFEIATQLSGFFFAQDLRLVTRLTPPAPPTRCVCLIFRFFAIGTGFCMHVRPLPNVELPRLCATGKQRASQRGSPTRSRVRGLSPRQTGEICCSNIDSNLQITILLHRNLLALELVHGNSALNASINDARAAMPL
jgi:hypothetical protein